MSTGPEGLTGHVLDYDALCHLLDGKSDYGREIVRQSVLRNTTLLLPALAAQCAAALRPAQTDALLAVPVITIGALTAADVAATTRLGPALTAPSRRRPPGGERDAELIAELAAVHAVLLAESRGGWRIVTPTPHLYDGAPGVRLEILP